MQCGALARRPAYAYICGERTATDWIGHLGAEMLDDVHPAQVAGLFYPAGAHSLRDLIGQMGKQGRPDGGVAPKVVVAPHAGIVYSGSVAATAFGSWARRAEPPRRIVIVGPAHRFAFRGLAIHPAMAWSTPLGEAAVARDLHGRLAEARAAVRRRAGPSPASIRSRCIS